MSPLGQSLKDFGLDSLLSMELRNALSRALGVKLPADFVAQHPNIHAIVQVLLGLLESGGGGAARPNGGTQEKEGNGDGVWIHRRSNFFIFVFGVSPFICLTIFDSLIPSCCATNGNAGLGSAGHRSAPSEPVHVTWDLPPDVTLSATALSDLVLLGDIALPLDVSCDADESHVGVVLTWR